MSRGWSTFITMNQPTPMSRTSAARASGLKIRATMTGGAQATNGPKNGIAMQDARRRPTSGPRAAARGAGSSPSRPGSRRRPSAPGRAGTRRTSGRPTSGAAAPPPRSRRDEAEQERHDRVAVDDHVDRQEEHDEHRPDGAEAGDGDLLERHDQLGRDDRRGWRGSRAPGRRGRPARARASRASPAAARGSSAMSPRICGSEATNCLIESDSAGATMSTTNTRITTTRCRR